MIGTSLGSRVVQESWRSPAPELIAKAIMLAATGRPHPRRSPALNRGQRALHQAGIDLPPSYTARYQLRC